MSSNCAIYFFVSLRRGVRKLSVIPALAFLVTVVPTLVGILAIKSANTIDFPTKVGTTESKRELM